MSPKQTLYLTGYISGFTHFSLWNFLSQSSPAPYCLSLCVGQDSTGGSSHQVADSSQNQPVHSLHLPLLIPWWLVYHIKNSPSLICHSPTWHVHKPPSRHSAAIPFTVRALQLQLYPSSGHPLSLVVSMPLMGKAKWSPPSVDWLHAQSFTNYSESRPIGNKALLHIHSHIISYMVMGGPPC